MDGQFPAGENPPGLQWLFFSFSGRIARLTYALSIIVLMAAQFVIVWQLVKAGEDQQLLALWGGVYILCGLFMIWPMLALSVKRLHDLSWPGAVAIALFIPWANFILFGMLIFLPSKPEANEHGPPPFPRTGSTRDRDS